MLRISNLTFTLLFLALITPNFLQYFLPFVHQGQVEAECILNPSNSCIELFDANVGGSAFQARF
jgi:hypothetical protein